MAGQEGEKERWWMMACPRCGSKNARHARLSFKDYVCNDCGECYDG